MKIVTIIGARPQFIKAAMVSKEIAQYPKLKDIIIHTGQHYNENMSEVFFKDMDIHKPNYYLGINNLSHGAMTGRMLEAIENILIDEKPDWVLVYGDTNSTLAGALAASKLHVPVAHVEAGLRSYNRKMPEEINRILTDHISDILFVPTDGAAENLKNEGISGNSIHQVGDVMYDAAMHFTQKAENQSSIMQKLDIKNDDYILATIHRPENTDNPEKLNNIVSALSHAPIPVILPLHPRTKRKCKDYNISIDGQIKQIDPVGFLDMLVLEKSAKAIATDSGGIQKEAFFFNVPCITMREETEWIELVDANVNILVGGEYAKILDSLYNFRPDDFNFSFFGSGNSAVKIVDQFTRL